MNRAIKLKGNLRVSNESLAVIIKTGKVYETGEVLDGKIVYAKRLVTTKTISADTDYMATIAHGIPLDVVDLAWIDVSNSYVYIVAENRNDYFRIIPIVATAYVTNSTDELSATIDKENVIIIANGGWAGWTKVVTVKFTLK